MRNYINLIEAVQKGCPLATHDLQENVKNRQTAIDKHHYGPANPDKPGNYWKQSAKQWDIDETTARTMQCANCAAFNITDKMYACIEGGMGPEAYEAEKTFTTIIDFYLLSPNMEATEVRGLALAFANSDHQPVRMTCKLK